ncbi:hypothetical protein [Magnetospirillum fulvum]|jgi:septal ring factor EnvC (AmiA/AmiB activator)|uniref:OmpA-like domain-containing protein n=1 Tax=Magnetospirillum fulvum MGU-K5 TaxID=1316936 RepID=S9SDG0_MAGFU|nr:hypothetical protein [Magnetospirillum fulvum]EPY02794.1 hypothetical protein K678_04301 [Magnetospirillum fulvum MGU-K5]
MADSNRELNYWPGFVDALSNVVLTLVFVLVVFVFALLITSSKMQQKTVQMVEQRLEQENTSHAKLSQIESKLSDAEGKLAESQKVRDKLAAEIAELRTANQRLEAFRQSVREKEAASTPSIVEKPLTLKNDSPAKSVDGANESADIVGGNVIVITYPRAAVLLNESSRAQLAKLLDSYRSRLPGSVAKIDSIMGLETYSEGRRMAYYRALDLRNFLLEKKLVGSQAIKITTKQGKDQGDARIELRFVRP